MAQITYADKSYLNQNASVPASNKVQDTDMNEIKTVVNTNDANVGDITTLATNTKTSVVSAINELKNADAYSTSEQKTNELWINNKPIYRKVIETGATTSTTGNNYVSTGISNLDACISLDGIFIVGSNRIPINFHNSVTAGGAYSFCCFYDYSLNKLNILNKTTITNGYVIMKYTKTTD